MPAGSNRGASTGAATKRNGASFGTPSTTSRCKRACIALAGKVAHPRRRVVHRILGYLDRIGQSREQGVEHVYFGHTHDALEHYRHGGVTFHNPGAPIAGLQFRIVETQ